MILDYVDAKKRGDIGKLFVMGCLSERYQKDLEKEIPEVDRYFGKFDLKAMVDELQVNYYPEYIYERKITTPSHYGYLKIAEGCNRSCAFCAIPMMTGRHKSRTIRKSGERSPLSGQKRSEGNFAHCAGIVVLRN
jgi:ribosomal protein S12 methylthiotransferase